MKFRTFIEFFIKNSNNTNSIIIIETDMPISKERDEIITFVQSSIRGIMRGYKPI